MDPLCRNIELPLNGTYYPVGFQLDISTNSNDVLEAAAEAWAVDGSAFSSPPIRFRVVVTPEGELTSVPVHRMNGHLYAVVADPFNFAHVDLRSEVAVFYVSQRTAADHASLRWFFIESIAYLVLAQGRSVPVHAACVSRNGRGILMSGASGAGKSTLAYACARAGWTYVSDDCTWLMPDSSERVVIGRPRQVRFRLNAPQMFPELEGYAVRARPNGKIGIELPLADLPHIVTAQRAAVQSIVFLERGPGKPGLHPMTQSEAAERMLADLPSYGPDVDAIHERTVRSFFQAPSWRMQYESLDEAAGLMETLVR